MTTPPIAVYIVDDDPAVREALARFMRSAGLRVELFASVIDLLDKGRFDEPLCIVADIRLPDISGLELPAFLAQQGRPRPVIFITAYDTDENRSAAHRAGAAAFFRKPVDGEALLDAINWAVGEHDRTSSGVGPNPSGPERGTVP
jgi:FixJ family two-component response regulator